MLHDVERVLCQKLLTLDDFPGTPLIGDIFEIINARRRKKYFFGPIFKGQSIDISF